MRTAKLDELDCLRSDADLLALLDDLAHPPWTLRCLQGHVDAPFVNLTPGTRSGLIHDTAYATLCEALQPLERKLVEVIEEQRRAADDGPRHDAAKPLGHVDLPSLRSGTGNLGDLFQLLVEPAANGASARLRGSTLRIRQQRSGSENHSSRSASSARSVSSGTSGRR